MTLAPLTDGSRLDALTALVYELLDAHQDTIELAARLPEQRWQLHLDYLRDLGRAGRELLALAHQAPPGPTGQPTSPRFGGLSR
jgi:hypothetical protein